MTRQAPDQVRFEGVTFDMPSARGTGLFRPEDHGLFAVVVATNLARGFCCTYVVGAEQRLLLDEVAIGLEFSRGDVAPMLFGVQGTRDGGMVRFENLRTAIAFSGGMLACREFIESYSTSSGIEPAWKYRDVFEMEFRDGLLVNKWDHSESVAELRARRRPRAVDFAIWTEFRKLMKTRELSEFPSVNPQLLASLLAEK